VLLKDFIPAPDVQEFIQLYRIVHLQFPKGQAIPYKAYPPRPEQCLAFYPFDTETVEYKSSGKKVEHLPVVLYGQFFEVTNRMIGNNFLVFQIIFKPGALYRLTGIPSVEITNQYLDAEIFFSSQIRLVNEQLALAKDYDNMLQIANDFVKQLIKQHKKEKLLIDDACLLLLNSEGKFSLEKISNQACLSSKQLERKFKERTGINPKLYERIIRFDKAFRLKNSKPDFDWLRIAIECNYHDYQHLSKAYKDFTGLSPTAFHEIENKAPEREFGLSEGYYNK
jgi:AraC-like DNA-binding protein